MDRELPVSPWPEWKIIEKTGEGSYGSVYKAERNEHGHTFYSAIKIISIPHTREELASVRQETGSDEATRKYFENVMEDCLQEISTMEDFRGNSYVVSVEDFKVTEYLDEIGWDIFIRMEFLTSFLDYCEGKTITEKVVLKLGCDLCKALDYCKRLNIIHRDIKPENIFISRFGDFKLGDFGIARQLERSVSSFSKKGTYTYMAPELYKGEAYDERADIYSLGLVMYRLMNCNRMPFVDMNKQLITYRDKENALARRMSGEEMPAPAEGSEDFGVIIKKACAYKREDRYQTANEFLQDLNKLRMGQSPRPGMEHSSLSDSEVGRQFEEARKSAMQALEESRQQKAAQKAREQAQREAEEQRRSEEIRKSAEERRNKREEQASRSWKRRFLILLLVLVAVLGAGVGGAWYVRQMVENTVRDQTRQMVSSLQSEENLASQESGEGFASAIQMISDRATTIVEELDDYTVEGEEGSRLRYYNADGELRKVLVYPDASVDGVYEEYYYWNDMMFFAYIWDDETVDMYYYRDGILIRWIDDNGIVHDDEQDNTEYMARGDKYWRNSIMEMS